MKNVRLVATRYAQALSAAVPDADTLERVRDDLLAISAAIEASSELRRVLANPVAVSGAKGRVVRAVAERCGADARTLRFLDVVAARDRLAALPEIAAAVDAELNRRAGVFEVEITSAVSLEDELRQRIAAALAKVAGGRVKITESVDPELLGGVVARIGTTLFDASLRTRLEKMRTRMLSGKTAGIAS
ncbi:MAG: ATP synthase F1 subunit delta [Acidobacteriota bacterium]|nr:ATP synthase F1 subunit delta [Acidobacteriota bacterium]